jgi:hypothetical protein
MDIRRAIQVRKQYDGLPIEAKQYVNDLVNETKQNPKSKYLEIFYKKSNKDNIIDRLLELKYNNANDNKIDQISFVAFKFWLFGCRFLTSVSIPKQLKKNANLFMLSIAIASNFVVEGDYKEIYGTSHIWGLTYNPNTTS